MENFGNSFMANIAGSSQKGKGNAARHARLPSLLRKTPGKPHKTAAPGDSPNRAFGQQKMRQTGFEPATPRVGVWNSIQ